MKKTIFAAALVASLFSATAGAVQVAPLYTVYEPATKAGVLKVTNTDPTPKTYQVIVDAWTVENGVSVRNAATDIRFAPSVFTVKPGQMQTVRWARTGAPGADEKAYRILVKEIPDPEVLKQEGIHNVMNIDSGWIFRPASLSPQLTARAEGNSLIVTNSGNATARLVDLVSGAASIPGLVGYVLPGETKTIVLSKKPSGNVSVKINDKDAQIEVR